MMELHTSNNVTLDGRYVGRIDWKRCKGRYERTSLDGSWSQTIFIYRPEFFNKNSKEIYSVIREPIYVGKGSNWKINPKLEAAVRQNVENDGEPKK